MSLWYLLPKKISKKSMRQGWHALDHLTWNYPMKHLFVLANVTMITVKMSFTHFHSSSCQENIFFHKIIQSISPNYNWENGVKQTEENLWQKLYLVSIAKDKDHNISVKMYQTFFLFLPLFALYLLNGCHLLNMSCLS